MQYSGRQGNIFSLNCKTVRKIVNTHKHKQHTHTHTQNKICLMQFTSNRYQDLSQNQSEYECYVMLCYVIGLQLVNIYSCVFAFFEFCDVSVNCHSSGCFLNEGYKRSFTYNSETYYFFFLPSEFNKSTFILY